MSAVFVHISFQLMFYIFVEANATEKIQPKTKQNNPQIAWANVHESYRKSMALRRICINLGRDGVIRVRMYLICEYLGLCITQA